MTENANPDPSRPRPPTVVWVLPILLVIPIPGLYVPYVLSQHSFRPVHFTLTTTMVAVAAAIVLGLITLSGTGLRTALVSTAAWLLVLFSWPILNAVGRILPGDLPVVEAVLPVAVAVGLLVMTARLGEEPATPLAISGLALVFAATMSADFWQRSAATAAEPPPVSAVSAATGPHPDVLLLVLDGYGSGGVLEEKLGIDNTQFESDLERRGFEIADGAMASYSMTWASLASMLALGYPYPEGTVSEAERALTRDLLGGDNALFDLFDQAGYEVVSFESAWDGSHCTSQADRCVRTGIIGRSLDYLMRLTVLRPLFVSRLAHPFATQGLAQLKILPEVVTADGDAPRLTVAHITLPHPPVNVDASCDLQVAPWRSGLEMAPEELSPEDSARRRSAYADQVACVNRLVLAALDAIDGGTRDTVVVITGDHGSDGGDQTGVPAADWSADDLVERFGILLAVGPTELCDTDEVATPVDAVRRATDCALGTRLGSLPERFLVAPAEGRDDPIVDVTDRLQDLTG